MHLPGNADTTPGIRLDVAAVLSSETTGFLRCRECHQGTPDLASGQVLLYLRAGWPECHGKAMDMLVKEGG